MSISTGDEMASYTDEASPQKYARIGGLLYLFIIVAAGFGELFVRNRLIVWGDAAATASNILSSETLFRAGLVGEMLTCACDVALALILYVLLRPVSNNLALLAAFFRLTFVGIYGVTKLFEIAALVGAHVVDERVTCAITPEGKETKTFKTMTGDLLQLADWIVAKEVTHVAMESTGEYWKPVFNILENNFEVIIVNAQHISKVPGRKTDQSDAEWIAELMQYGLLKASFVPPLGQRELRELTRYRSTFVRERATLTNRVQKALESANIKLASVASTPASSGMPRPARSTFTDSPARRMHRF
jgi:hypothetical protein